MEGDIAAGKFGVEVAQTPEKINGGGRVEKSLGPPAATGKAMLAVELAGVGGFEVKHQLFVHAFHFVINNLYLSNGIDYQAHRGL